MHGLHFDEQIYEFLHSLKMSWSDSGEMIKFGLIVGKKKLEIILFYEGS